MCVKLSKHIKFNPRPLYIFRQRTNKTELRQVKSRWQYSQYFMLVQTLVLAYLFRDQLDSRWKNNARNITVITELSFSRLSKNCVRIRDKLAESNKKLSRPIERYFPMKFINIFIYLISFKNSNPSKLLGV